MSKIVWSGMYIDKVIVPERISIDLELLEDYAKVKIIDNEIVKIGKEKNGYNDLSKNPKTIATIKKEFEECLQNYIAKAETDLKRIVIGRQTGETSPFVIRIDNVVDILREITTWKNLSKQVYLIPSTDIKGMAEEIRQAKVKDCIKRIEKLNKEKQKFFHKGQTHWYNELQKKADRWIAVVVQCGKPVDVNGKWLNEDDETDKRWLKVYHDLKFDEIQKHKLRSPVIINGKEFEYHPGFHYKEKTEEE